MKRIISFVFTLLVILPLFPVVAYADTVEEVILLENGDYITVTTQTTATYASGTKTGKRPYTFTHDGVIKWQATLTATYTYNGITSVCTSASCPVEIYDSTWYVVSKSVVKSGNAAMADITKGYKVLGVTVSKSSYTITLFCDKDGNLN